MSKVAEYLQEHLVGEVITSTDARHYFSTDNSIVQLVPALIVYPRHENDIRKTARFSWQLAERGRTIPLTARGAGTDNTGAAIGGGMILVFPAHMNRILELNSKGKQVTVEPGLNFGKLQQALHTHGLFLPPYPPSLDYITLGGALANNMSGEKSVKYGDMRASVESLRVVLANGEAIETKRLHKRELNKKLGLATFEGEVYRSIDTLIEEQHPLIDNTSRGTVRNNAGYDLLDVKRSDGSFDLTPLMLGSQGTLGIITEATLKLASYNPKTTLFLARFDSVEQLQNAVLELRELEEKPSAIELINESALDQVQALNINLLKDVIEPPFPAFTVLVEFDGHERAVKKSSKRTEKILGTYAQSFQVTAEPEEQLSYWKIRQVVNSLNAHNDGLIHAVPLFDGAVPVERLREYLEGLYELLTTNNVKPAIWGQVGEAILQVRPRLNLGQVGDRQKAFRLLEQYHKLILSLNGTISASGGEGRVHAPYLEQMYGEELLALNQKVKQILDPYGILNPGVKLGTNIDDLKAMIRSEYSLDHIYDHLPRS